MKNGKSAWRSTKQRTSSYILEKKISDTKITDPENKNEFYTARELRRGRGHLPVCRKARDR